MADAIGGDVQAALEALNVPAFMVDVEGTIGWANPAAIRAFGDNRGRPIWSVVAPEQSRHVRELLARLVLGNVKTLDEQAVAVAADGSRVAVEFSASPLHEHGHLIGVFGLVTHQMSVETVGSHPRITPRQMQVLRMLAEGYSTQQIADELKLSVETVRNHVRHLLRALGAHSRLEALATARREGLLR